MMTGLINTNYTDVYFKRFITWQRNIGVMYRFIDYTEYGPIAKGRYTA
jgi:hypothetical protein